MLYFIAIVVVWLGVILFFIDKFVVWNWKREQAALQAQQYWAAQPMAPSPPAVTRTERTVTVVRAPQAPTPVRNAVAIPKPPESRRDVNQPRPLRHSEDHGYFTIDDRRPFDPDLGE